VTDWWREPEPDDGWTNGEKLVCWLVGLGLLLLAGVVWVLESLY